MQQLSVLAFRVVKKNWLFWSIRLLDTGPCQREQEFTAIRQSTKSVLANSNSSVGIQITFIFPGAVNLNL